MHMFTTRGETGHLVESLMILKYSNIRSALRCPFCDPSHSEYQDPPKRPVSINGTSESGDDINVLGN